MTQDAEHPSKRSPIPSEDAAGGRTLRPAAGNGPVSEEDVHPWRSEFAGVKAQRDAAFVCIQKLTMEGASLAGDLEKSRAEVADLMAERDLLRDRVAALSAELERIGSEVTALKSQVTEQRAPVSASGPGEVPAIAVAAVAFSPLPFGASVAAEEFAGTMLNDKGSATHNFFDASAEDDFFGTSAATGDEPIFFLLQKGIFAVEYESTAEVLNLYQSINFAYVSPEGKAQESCKGYVCGVIRGGSRKVYAALMGLESGKTWIYSPEEQPADDAGYARAVQEALRFAEEVGFLMEGVLPGAAGQQAEAIARCPVLRGAH